MIIICILGLELHIETISKSGVLICIYLCIYVYIYVAANLYMDDVSRLSLKLKKDVIMFKQARGVIIMDKKNA